MRTCIERETPVEKAPIGLVADDGANSSTALLMSSVT